MITTAIGTWHTEYF